MYAIRIPLILTSASLLLVASGVPGTAPAQEVAALEEIIVTATRREESLQDVPVSVAAFSFEDIELRGIEEIEDLNIMVPNATFVAQNVGGEAGSNFRIRGLPGVETYVDGIWQASGANLLTRNIVEIERIEVLRGPQGTLFGRGATGGAVQVVSRRPEDEFGGRVALTVGGLNQRDVVGSVNIPLTDNLLTKWTGANLTRDGYVQSIEVNQAYGDVNNTILRGDILWTPTENFSARIILDNNTFDQASIARVIAAMTGLTPEAQIGQSLAYNNIVRAGTNPNITELITDANNTGGAGGIVGEWQNRTTLPDGGWQQDLESATIDLNWDITDSLTLRSISGWRQNDSRIANDIDGTQYVMFHSLDFNQQKQFTQEIQFLGDMDRFSYVVGLYYWDAKGKQSSYDWFYNEFVGTRAGPGRPPTGDWATCVCMTPTDSIPTPGSNRGAGGGGNTGEAIFFDLTFNISDVLRLSVGYRDNSEEIWSGSYINLNPFPAELNGLTFPSFPDPYARTQTEERRGEWDSDTFRAVLQYDFSDDIMGYVSVSDGFSAGGFNNFPIRFFNPPFFTTYDPETNTNTEIGLRSDLAGGRLRLNASIFDMDYDDIQIATQTRQFYDPVTMTFFGNIIPLVQQANAGRASVDGIEIDLVWRPTDNWRFDLSAANLDAKYLDLALGVTQVTLDSAFSGAPENSASLGIQYNADLPNGGSLTTRLNYGWQDDVRFSENENVNFDQESYGLANLRINYAPPSGDYRLGFFVDNLTEEYYFTSTLAGATPGTVFATVGRPRQAGVELQFNFD